ncbi:SDR family oxidoreductase [Actinomadura algeriensis]|uniref:Nucleoside-diphosphate-sugar epimerase n=1 Tax=Actinomadura algeriensis TaxID=1679523 RepID=A0ABR9JKM2_9ACTN|nr:SDR family oxidoreductase [Actinomadura algeriensis]MBE1531099.1 nucleoside-diphosphate-sugar epimerase [Actinomadura algeriensis]
MRYFVTGASGFIGSALVRELIGAGHRVVGLARSDAAAASLAAAGAEVHRGSLDDPGGLAVAAKAADGVAHLAYNHDFTDMAAAGAADLRAVEAMGGALEGSGKPFVVTSGTLLAARGRVVTEDDAVDLEGFGAARGRSEVAAIELAGRGVRSSVLRLPPSVHGRGDRGFVPTLIGVAREKGVAAYVGDGSNRWPSVHRLDAARLFRLALEGAPAGARLHGVADGGVPMRDIAGVIGRRLGVPVASVAPEEAASHFGWIGPIASIDNPTSAEPTRNRLGWEPQEPGLIADLDEGHYFGS